MYDDAIKGQYARHHERDDRPQGALDHRRRVPARASPATSPWAHLDIAGVMNDLGLPYAAKGGSGFGVRLLVDVARGVANGTRPA